ncbi:MAG: hypothetical protein HQL28_04430 [Candidatus Omnitrophica bacterium]|nr:hypothetical protein [Candidatus Omnitrophota bacterium]
MAKRSFFFVVVVLSAVIFSSVAGAENASLTPKEKEVSGYLGAGSVVFLCFYKPADPALGGIKSTIAQVAANFKGTVGTVSVSSEDKQENILREKYKIRPDETAVLVVSPSGKAPAKLSGMNITKTNLMKTIVSPCGGGTCCSGCK